jgi:protein-L-isoaspartate(D-aspartate) O-methyltransferase
MDDRAPEREFMVRTQITSRGVLDQNVIAAMQKVARHLFVTDKYSAEAYADHPLPIGQDQTISQPYIVALMSELCGINRSDRVLEIGTGSGYQTAILAELASEVYTIERLHALSDSAMEKLSGMGYTNIQFRTGNGYLGWKEAAPFDVIILTAAPPEIPKELISQLADGGRIVAPVGTVMQELIRGVRRGDQLDMESIIYVRFVPML